MSTPLITTGARDHRTATNTTTGQILTATGWTLRLLAWAFATLFIAGFTGVVRKKLTYRHEYASTEYASLPVKDGRLQPMPTRDSVRRSTFLLTDRVQLGLIGAVIVDERISAGGTC